MFINFNVQQAVPAGAVDSTVRLTAAIILYARRNERDGFLPFTAVYANVFPGAHRAYWPIAPVQIADRLID